MGFPCGSAGKESTCNVGDLGSIPGLGWSPGEGKGYPLQYSCLENSIDCIVHEVAKSQTHLSCVHLHFGWYSNWIPLLGDPRETLEGKKRREGASFFLLACSCQCCYRSSCWRINGFQLNCYFQHPPKHPYSISSEVAAGTYPFFRDVSSARLDL